MLADILFMLSASPFIRLVAQLDCWTLHTKSISCEQGASAGSRLGSFWNGLCETSDTQVWTFLHSEQCGHLGYSASIIAFQEHGLGTYLRHKKTHFLFRGSFCLSLVLRFCVDCFLLSQYLSPPSCEVSIDAFLSLSLSFSA